MTVNGSLILPNRGNLCDVATHFVLGLVVPRGRGVRVPGDAICDVNFNATTLLCIETGLMLGAVSL